MRVWFVVAGLVPALCFAQQIREVPPRMGHLLYLPRKTWASGKKWPLILYLHGKSLRGNDLSKVSKYGLPHRLKTDKHFPFVVVSPQLWPNERWTDTTGLLSLIEDVCRLAPIDRSRIFVIGYSMGGSGAWRVAHASPRTFAALISVAGTYEKPLAADGRLKRLPVWMIHGDQDKDASPKVAQETFALHKRAGGAGFFSMMKGKDHNIPSVLERSDVYQWLLKQRKR